MTSQTQTATEPDYEAAPDLEAYVDTLIASRDSREPDWDTLSFQTKAGPQYARAQIRYVGSGATGSHEDDQRIIPSRGFTFSNMLLPPGAEGPEHTHHDAEEAFFVLEGEVEVGIHRGDDVVRRTLGYRDMIVVPAGVPRSLRNPGETDALFCVVIGKQKPQVPVYPTTSPVYGLTRDSRQPGQAYLLGQLIVDGLALQQSSPEEHAWICTWPTGSSWSPVAARV